MPRQITETCISCAACASECPTGAIEEGEDRFLIHAQHCDDCAKVGEVLCESACPLSDAITTA